MGRDLGYFLSAHKLKQVRAVALLLLNEERECFGKVRIACGAGIGATAVEKAPTLGAFAQLELLDGVLNGAALRW